MMSRRVTRGTVKEGKGEGELVALELELVPTKGLCARGATVCVGRRKEVALDHSRVPAETI